MPVPLLAREFWHEFSAALGGVDERRFYEAFAFGDSEELAAELAELVHCGRKRATASAVWSYKAEGQSLPSPGNLSIVTDWAGEPLCVIETTAVELVPFNRVSAEFAAAEGEGDGSLDDWRHGHRAFFARECQRAGRAFTEEMLVCCERFEVVYRRKGSS